MRAVGNSTEGGELDHELIVTAGRAPPKEGDDFRPVVLMVLSYVVVFVFVISIELPGFGAVLASLVPAMALSFVAIGIAD